MLSPAGGFQSPWHLSRAEASAEDPQQVSGTTYHIMCA